MGTYNYADYYRWLVERVDDRRHLARRYSNVLGYLYDKEFTWIIPMDENRAKDGTGLRYEFDENFDDDSPCSVLEFLIALAVNWEHEITYDFRKGDRSSEWFWLMVENLGLLDYPDYNFDEFEVNEIVDIFLNRDYQSNGQGGIFPLRESEVDQTSCDIWMQMQSYVLENW